MKGMEGGADSDRDNQITARELHTYVRENVVQQSGGSQVPELQGDAEGYWCGFGWGVKSLVCGNMLRKYLENT